MYETPPIEWFTSPRHNYSAFYWICLLLSPSRSIKFIVMKSRFDLISPFELIPVVWLSRFSSTCWAFVTTAAILSLRAIVIAWSASEKLRSTSIKVYFSISSRDATLFVQFLEKSFHAVWSPKNSMSIWASFSLFASRGSASVCYFSYPPTPPGNWLSL